MNLFKVVLYIPLFFLLLLFYHIMVMVGVNFGGTETLFSLSLPSEAKWALRWSDLFVMLGVIILYIEVIKSTRTATGTIFEHALSMVVFLAFLMDFLFFSSAGTSAFLIVTLMSLLDVIAGFTITVASARRDLTMGG